MDRNMAAITMQNGQLDMPNNPVVHYIEGDGIGIDITPVMIDVVNAAVEKAYSGEKEIAWNEVLAGEKAFNTTGEWLPEDTLDAIRSGLVSIKGPLTTPVGGGIRIQMLLFDKSWTSMHACGQCDEHLELRAQ